MSVSAITTRPSTATAAIDAMLSKARTTYFTTCNMPAAAHRARRADKQPAVAPPRSFSAKLGGERIICTTAADAADVAFVDRLFESSANAADEATWNRLIELMQSHGRHRAARRLTDLRDAAAV